MRGARVAGGALELTGSRAIRGLVLLERDADGEEQAVHVQAVVARARCVSCGHRPRVLPSDAFAGKTFGVAVIAALAAKYATGEFSLRKTAWSLLGDRTPAHTTLHAWTEGLGAYGLGRPRGEVPGGDPFSAVTRATRDRFPAMETPLESEPLVNPSRYGSEPRRERLQSMARIVAAAEALWVDGEGSPPLVGWRQLAIEFGYPSPLSFRTGLKNPRFEHDAGSGRDPPR